ncbi:MAG: glycolate oxidase subunit GlcF, partial [Rhodospirillales bacterium]|nr:glycolate oxidase subunit GlcF [Rhodospirillales bacterium]
RKCVHCGFCTATCPTYVLLGDENDSPRGRIYMIKDMLEKSKPAPAKVVKHIDRCLTCLSCTSTCPSGVDYMHLIDHARVHVEETFSRPPGDRLLRMLLAFVVPNPAIFRLSLIGARLARPFKGLMPGRLKGMIAMAPDTIPVASYVDGPQVFAAEGARRMRVALMTGCAQKVLRPSINEATVRLLTRHGCEVVVASGAACCGALVQHMGKEQAAHAAARNNIAAWTKEADGEGLDAIVINASGCGTTLKDYGFMLKDDPAWADRAAKISALAKDVTEVMTSLGVGDVKISNQPVVVYHSACSMQHGQKLRNEPKNLLKAAGFEVREPAEGHLCCGSAGTYNLLQPEIAECLKVRKAANLEAQGAAVIVTGNIGCQVQISGATDTPVVHTVELLDWATGGTVPPGLE